MFMRLLKQYSILEHERSNYDRALVGLGGIANIYSQSKEGFSELQDMMKPIPLEEEKNNKDRKIVLSNPTPSQLANIGFGVITKNELPS